MYPAPEGAWRQMAHASDAFAELMPSRASYNTISLGVGEHGVRVQSRGHEFRIPAAESDL